MKNYKKKRGFTLIELVIVISIIAILVAIALPRFSKSNLSAQAAAHNANVNILKNATLLYLNDNPEAKSVTVENLKDYIEGNIPKPAKNLKKDSFSIDISQGDIKVIPGKVKVSGRQLVADQNESNTGNN